MVNNVVILWQMWSQVTIILFLAAVAQQFWCHLWGRLGHICDFESRLQLCLQMSALLAKPSISRLYWHWNSVNNEKAFECLSVLQRILNAFCSNLFSPIENFIGIPICPLNQKPWSVLIVTPLTWPLLSPPERSGSVRVWCVGSSSVSARILFDKTPPCRK